MSSGSRATRRNLKREHPAPSDYYDRFFDAGTGSPCPQLRAFGHPNVDARGTSSALARDPVLKLDRAGEKEPFGYQRQI
jgi:hypothetical protein